MKEFIIDEKSEGKKLFRFIKIILPGLKNTEIFKLIRKKIVLVNNKRQSSNYILGNKDIIQIFLADKHFDKKGKSNKFYSINKDLDIIFEDNNLLVINKSAGLLTHPDKNEYKKNIYEITRAYLYAKGEYMPDDIFTPTPCHRLDKNTSGLILIAKNHSTLKNITKQFRERCAIKKYLAIVYGEIRNTALLTSLIETKNDKVEVKEFRRLNNICKKEDFIQNYPDKSATLIYPKRTIKDYSLVEIELWTGKKHQIRVHLAGLGHPLLGDKKYYNKDSLIVSKKYNIESFFLHSYKLQIQGYPEWSAMVPDNFKNMLINLWPN